MRWINGVEKACNAKLLKLTDAKVRCIGNEQSRDFVNGTNDILNVVELTGNFFDAKI